MTTTEQQSLSTETGPLALIRRRPILSFFVLANGLSWLAWIPYILSPNGIGAWHYRFPSLLGTGQLLGVIPGAYLGPITAALIVTAVTGGRVGLRQWAGRLLRWRVNWRWYVAALLGVPAAMIITGFVFSGGHIQAPALMTVALYVPLLIFQMITTGLAEEPGWRDFALPRLQRRYGPLRAASILGPLWALWHMPLFLTDWGGWPDAGWTRVLFFTIFCIGFNFVITWFFNRTGESLPLSMLLHVSINTFASLVWANVFPTIDGNGAIEALAIGAVIAAGFVLITTRGRLGYSPALGTSTTRF